VDGKTGERASQQPNAPALNKEAEDLTAEVTGGSVGETIGESVGEAVGEALLGPLGMAIGAAIGGEIGGQIGEAGGLDVEKLIDSKLQNRQTQRHNRKNTQRGT
jgi:phage tail tape-measure protein